MQFIENDNFVPDRHVTVSGYMEEENENTGQDRSIVVSSFKRLKSLLDIHVNRLTVIKIYHQ